MDYCEFIQSTILAIDQETLETLKEALVGEYLPFWVIDKSEVTAKILAEKLCDYFEKLELKTGKSFDKHLETYFDDIESIVGNRVAKAARLKKGDPAATNTPRARKYYEKALSIGNTKDLSAEHLLNYTRIMMCLYAAIVKNGYKKISNLNYSASSINPSEIIDSMKNERGAVLKLKKQKFEVKNHYSSDTCTFIIAIIMLYRIVEKKYRECAAVNDLMPEGRGL